MTAMAFQQLRRRRRRRRSLCFAAAITVSILLAITNSLPPMTAAAASGGSGSGSEISSSRAYPLGCLHRHPSYYTYDERDDITFDILPSNAVTTVIANETSQVVLGLESGGALDHVDFRTLPNKSSKLRQNYNQYRINRQLGSGKFSEVFEAVNVRRELKMRRHQRRQSRRRHTDDGKRKNNANIVGMATAVHDVDAENNNDDQRMDHNHSSLVVLKCLKPISERKIRRELLVLTHCNTLPNVVRLIGIILPESMDDHDENNDNKNNNDDAAVECNDSVSLENQRMGDKIVTVNEQRYRVNSPSSPSVSSSSTTTRIDRRNGRLNNNHPQEQLPALVLEHAGPDSQWLCHNAPQQQQQQQQHNEQLPAHLTEHEIKYYLCHLLIALDGLHAAGIMHRDVKPRNMLINRRFPLPRRQQQHDSHGKYVFGGTDDDDGSTTSYDNEEECMIRQTTLQSPQHLIPLMLVDLGLADFYHPGKSYNVRVASRHYKSPELLIGYDKYDYSIDLWAVGCILAGLLFRKEPFFRGKDNDDQLGRIVSVLGVQDFLWYRRKCGVRLSAGARAAIGKYCWKANTATSSTLSSIPSPSSSSSSSSEDEDVQSVFSGMRYRKPWHTFLSPNCPIPSPLGLDLLDKLLVYDHEQRWTAREALNHAFFDDVREQVFEEVRVRMEWERSHWRTQHQHSFSNASFGGRQKRKKR
jgi:serine/threonine protein kinase